MEFRQLIQARRSVRAYEKAPAHEDLVEILKMAQMAPSWKNMQASRCYVAEGAETLEKLKNALHPANQKKPGPAALIVTTYVKDQVGFTKGEPDNEVGNGWGAYDLGLHDAYLVLAASEMGYDTLIMGLRDAQQIRQILSIPENEEVMAVIAVGKRAEEPLLRPRKPLEETVKFF